MSAELSDRLPGGSRPRIQEVVMWRILLDGIRALDGSNGEGAEKWVAAADDEGALSFQNLCAGLGIDADTLRAALALGRKKREPVQSEETRAESPPAVTSRRTLARRGHSVRRTIVRQYLRAAPDAPVRNVIPIR